MVFLKRRKNEKGFTLMEILVALSLLTVGLLAVASMTAGIIQKNYHGKQATTATTLAQDQLEEVRRIGYAATADDTDDYNTMVGFEEFRRETDVQDNTPAAGMKTVTVTVLWNNGVSSVSMQTILSP